MAEELDARTLVMPPRPASLDTVPAAVAADLVLLAAIRLRPDAVMVEPEDERQVVRCEYDGVVSTIASMAPAHGDAVAARLMLLARLDIVGPSQIGRVRVRADDDELELLILPRATPAGLAIELRPLLAAARTTPSAAPPRAPADGSDAPYHLLSELGRGGMGIVYRAEHVLLQKHVALKVLAPGLADDPDMIAHFLVEARAACRARHPGIVDVTDFGWLPDGRAFYVMELVDGVTLDHILVGGNALPAQRALRIASQVADVLRAASASGIVHRDLKPGNVFLLSGDHVKVGDFGLARIIGGAGPASVPAKTHPAAPVGTPAYMSPEQARNEAVDVRSDIYSLACMLFEMLTGQLPYSGKTLFVVLEQHQSAPIPPIVAPDGPVPDVLANVIRRAMAKRREERHQSAEELIADLDRAYRALERSGWRRWLPT